MPQIKRPADTNTSHVQAYRPNMEIKDMYYNMNNRHRGLALIFNHEKFDNPSLTVRNATKVDRDRLEKVLSNLGFRVEVKNDLSYKEINNTLLTVAKANHTNNDCLLITVLTHGELGTLHARDTHYSLKNLWCYFTDQNCPTLAKKPKIFFIQACRGDKYDEGITLKVDGVPRPHNNPIHPDFIFGFSTVSDYYSWRNSANGSWFIQALCDVLIDYASDTDILGMLTLVCHRVAVDYESYTPSKVDTHEKKEIPSIYSTLTRLLMLNTKGKKKTNECCIQS